MWRPSPKSSLHIHHSYSPPFSCSSFKDIQRLCADDHPHSPSPHNPFRVFHRLRLANSVLRSWPTLNPQQSPQISIPGAENSILVYLTSLRVVRSTFEDCRAVRSILRGFRVRIEERDLSMDATFGAELRRVFGGQTQRLPRVFIGGKYVGGAEEVKQMQETGELKKLVECLPKVETAPELDCEVCGGYGFVPCGECDGRHKVYKENRGFGSCRECNENGLTRCPYCSSPTPS